MTIIKQALVFLWVLICGAAYADGLNVTFSQKDYPHPGGKPDCMNFITNNTCGVVLCTMAGNRGHHILPKQTENMWTVSAQSCGESGKPEWTCHAKTGKEWEKYIPKDCKKEAKKKQWF